jgi:hypothetical protein
LVFLEIDIQEQWLIHTRSPLFKPFAGPMPPKRGDFSVSEMFDSPIILPENQIKCFSRSPKPA